MTFLKTIFATSLIFLCSCSHRDEKANVSPFEVKDGGMKLVMMSAGAYTANPDCLNKKTIGSSFLARYTFNENGTYSLVTTESGTTACPQECQIVSSGRFSLAKASINFNQEQPTVDFQEMAIPEFDLFAGTMTLVDESPNNVCAGSMKWNLKRDI